MVIGDWGGAGAADEVVLRGGGGEELGIVPVVSARAPREGSASAASLSMHPISLCLHHRFLLFFFSSKNRLCGN